MRKRDIKIGTRVCQKTEQPYFNFKDHPGTVKDIIRRLIIVEIDNPKAIGYNDFQKIWNFLPEELTLISKGENKCEQEKQK